VHNCQAFTGRAIVENEQAIAAHDRAAAQPVIELLVQTGVEHAQLRRLAAELEKSCRDALSVSLGRETGEAASSGDKRRMTSVLARNPRMRGAPDCPKYYAVYLSSG
jgi:hypothetical protein